MLWQNMILGEFNSKGKLIFEIGLIAADGDVIPVVPTNGCRYGRLGGFGTFTEEDSYHSRQRKCWIFALKMSRVAMTSTGLEGLP
jgi:hypothetical protein